MPPIPIHRNAPIAPPTTAAKPDGITPSTLSSNPSSSKNPPPTRTTPAHAPATTTQSSSNPPAPQPGARPVAPTEAVSQVSSSGTGAPPPPPQAGATPTPTATFITTETHVAGPPPQFTRPPPSDSQLAGRSTTTSTTASKAGPTTLDYGPAVASPYQTADTGGAAEPTGEVGGGAQRSSLEHPPGYVQAPDNAPYTAGGGIGVPGSSSGGGDSTEGVGATAWNMLSKAGEALKKGEEAAWRAVRNK